MENPAPLHVLVIEDHLGDFILIEDYLIEEHTKIVLTRAISYTEARILLTSATNFDAILLDLSLPDSANSETLVKDIVNISGEAPVIVLTGNSNKDFGVKTLSMGISDYLFKDELNPIQLSKSIFYSIERKKIETQLSLSEKKYKNLFDHSPLPKFVLDLHTLQFLSINKAAIELYGYSANEFSKMSVRDLWIEGDEKTIEENWKRNYNDWFQISVRHRKKNGEIIYTEIISNPIEYEGREARVSLVHDVTAQIKAEQDLLHSEQRFRALVQDGSDLVMIMDFNGKISYASPSSKTVMGVAKHNLLQNNFFYYIHPDDVDKVKECILELRNQKRKQIPSYRIKTADDNWKWIETIVTNSNNDPSVNGIVVNSRDISDFVKQERKLMESLKRYDIVAKATSDTITDYDVEKDVMKYNEGIQNMFGYCPHSVSNEGKWWTEKIHPDDRKRVEKRTKEVYSNNENQLQIEYRFKCADGSYKYIFDRSYLLKDDNGKPLRMIGSIQDQTEIHKYIETIENHNARLKEIAWTQSHVVRAPLARLMGIIDLLQNHEDIVDQKTLLDNILSSAKELDAIIRKINSKAEHSTENSIKC